MMLKILELPIIISISLLTWCTVNAQPIEIKAKVTLQWDTNIEVDLAGYKIYQSNKSGIYTKTPIVTIELPIVGIPKFQVEALSEGNVYYWVATAYDIHGNESNYSNEVRTTLIIPPNPPSDLSVAVELIYPVEGEKVE